MINEFFALIGLAIVATLGLVLGVVALVYNREMHVKGMGLDATVQGPKKSDSAPQLVQKSEKKASVVKTQSKGKKKQTNRQGRR